MKKKMIAMILAVCMVVSLATGAVAAEPDDSMYITCSYCAEGRIYMPCYGYHYGADCFRQGVCPYSWCVRINNYSRAG
jgi:hypothetical protein